MNSTNQTRMQSQKHLLCVLYLLPESHQNIYRLFLFLLQVIMIQNLSPSQQLLVPNIIPLDVYQINYMEKVDREHFSLYKDHFSSSLLGKKGKQKSSSTVPSKLCTESQSAFFSIQTNKTMFQPEMFCFGKQKKLAISPNNQMENN